MNTIPRPSPDALAQLFRSASSVTKPESTSTTTSSHPGTKLEEPNTAIQDIAVDLLTEMKQPFPLYNEEEIESLAKSIRSQGVLQRILVRPMENGTYQIISGRHRRRGAIQAGLDTVPCEVHPMSDEAAREAMLETNLHQRENLPISAKAWAYRELYELVKRAVGRPLQADKKLCPSDTIFRSDDEVAISLGISSKTLHRYIRLTNLLPTLLTNVDAGKLGIRAGVELSYLSEENQTVVETYFFDRLQTIDQKLAVKLREIGERGNLTPEEIDMLLSPAVKPLRKLSIHMKPIRDLFPPAATPKEIEHTIIEAVKFYFEAQNERR